MPARSMTCTKHHHHHHIVYFGRGVSFIHECDACVCAWHSSAITSHTTTYGDVVILIKTGIKPVNTLPDPSFVLFEIVSEIQYTQIHTSKLRVM